jgi:hypothetical protein
MSFGNHAMSLPGLSSTRKLEGLEGWKAGKWKVESGKWKVEAVVTKWWRSGGGE